VRCRHSTTNTVSRFKQRHGVSGSFATEGYR